MGKRWKQGAVSLLSASALLTVGQGVYAAQPVQAVQSAQAGEKIPSWAAADIQTWQQLGLLKGDAAGRIQPNRAVTRAELAAMLNRVYGYAESGASAFADVPADAWYASDIAKVAAAGIMQGDESGHATPLASVTREQAAVMLSRALHLGAASAPATFADEGQIASWAKDAVHALQAAGYVAGTPAGEFQPKKSLTRAEAVKMLNGAMGLLVADGAAHDGLSGANLTVNAAGATLAGLSLTGDLYIAPGVGDGEVTVEGASVDGTIYVFGGGDHTVVLKNTKAGRVVVDKPSGGVRVRLEGDTTVPSVELASGGEWVNESTQPVGRIVVSAGASQKVRLSGDITELNMTTGAALDIAAGHVSRLTVSPGASGAGLSLASGVVLDTLTADGAVKVTGDGTIGTAVINVEGVTLAKAPLVLTLNAASVQVAGETKTAGSAAGGNVGGGIDLSTKLYSYAEASSLLGSTTAEVQVKQYIAFLQDPTYQPSVANTATDMPDLVNATTFVNASFTVKPSVFASLRGVNSSVLDASRTWLWLGTNDGVTRIRLTDNAMTGYTKAGGDLKDDKVLLLIADGKTGVYVITETGVSHIQQ